LAIVMTSHEAALRDFQSRSSITSFLQLNSLAAPLHRSVNISNSNKKEAALIRRQPLYMESS
jgi:hypothetical protein